MHDTNKYKMMSTYLLKAGRITERINPVVEEHLRIYGQVSAEHEPHKNRNAETRHTELIVELYSFDHHQCLDRLQKFQIDFWRMVK